jgi:hypothetical protein
MIRRRPHQLTPEQVKSAAAWYYYQYHENGMNTHTRHMVWIIWDRARDIASDEWAREESAHYEALQEQIKGLQTLLGRSLIARFRAWQKGVKIK